MLNAKLLKGVVLLALCTTITAGAAFAGGVTEQGDRIIGSGNTTTEVRNVTGFSKIVVAGSGDVQITPGRQFHVEITAEDNLLPYLTTDVNGDTLVLGTRPHFSYTAHSRVRYRISLPELSGAQISGSGDITVLEPARTDRFDLSISGSGSMKGTINATSVTARISGSGNLTISGKADRLDIQISGSGKADFRSMHGGDVTVSIGGSGDAWVVADGTLSGTISGSGTLNYSGDARPTVSSSGSGKIRPF